MSFEALPPATLEDARKIVAFLLHRNEELTEQAALLAAGVGTNRLYLERALEGIQNTVEADDD
ncbi:hypothetical protein AGMMS49545_02210 [Betaproteobacteria bacterium]|nr:hypothetical protein AGMMS49545_02210 [Betaproteobacteria bacterium]GHU43816.1 hypothetical protein AGMMS50289_10900 [Betaproteobacteria bacterium]